jgi:hypothetical protein
LRPDEALRLQEEEQQLAISEYEHEWSRLDAKELAKVGLR